ncbi:hypothetical protein D4764_16G0005490, partial [Takifugu flavidus]
FQDEFHKNGLLQLQHQRTEFKFDKNQQMQREERSNSSPLWQNAKDVYERSRETGRLTADAKLVAQKTHGCRTCRLQVQRADKRHHMSCVSSLCSCHCPQLGSETPRSGPTDKLAEENRQKTASHSECCRKRQKIRRLPEAHSIWTHPATQHRQHPATQHRQHPASLHRQHPASLHRQHPATLHRQHPATLHRQHPASQHRQHPATQHRQHPATLHRQHPATLHRQHPATLHRQHPATLHRQHPATQHRQHPATLHRQHPASLHRQHPASLHRLNLFPSAR